MLKVIILLIFSLSISNAIKLEITANNFEADEIKGISKFIGNVNIIKGQDNIKSENLIVYFGKDKKPYKYEADINASFRVSLDKDKVFKGKANSIVYLPNKQEYLLIGDAYIEDISTNKKIIGDKILLNTKDGKAQVFGNEKKPVKFIFTIEEEENK